MVKKNKYPNIRARCLLAKERDLTYAAAGGQNRSPGNCDLSANLSLGYPGSASSARGSTLPPGTTLVPCGLVALRWATPESSENLELGGEVDLCYDAIKQDKIEEFLKKK